MSIALSFVEQDILDGVKGSHPLLADEVEKIGIQIIKNGGTVRIEEANVASLQQIRNEQTLRKWMTDFRKKHDIMSLAEAVNLDPAEKPGKVHDIPDRSR